MTQRYRKAQIESALGHKGRWVRVHRCVLREWPGDPDPEIGTIIEASPWLPNQSGLSQANRTREAWKAKEGPTGM